MQRAVDPTNSLHQSLIISKLWVIDQTTSDPDACNDAGARTHYVGMLKPFEGNLNGMGRVGGDQLWFALRVGPPTSDPPGLPSGPAPINTPGSGVTLAHELGHNYGLPHTDCGNPADPGYYPYGDACRFANDQYPNYGFDRLYWSAVIPYTANVGDLMSYANYRWPSDYTWYRLRSGLNAEAAQASAASSGSQPAAVRGLGDMLLAAGIAGSNPPTATLTTVARLPQTYLPVQKLDRLLAANVAAGAQAVAATVSYRLELLNPTGQVLLAQAFTPDTPSDGPLGLFGLVVPYAEGASQVRVVRDGEVLAERTISAHAPAVRVTSPNGGEVAGDTLTVRWGRVGRRRRPPALHGAVQSGHGRKLGDSGPRPLHDDSDRVDAGDGWQRPYRPHPRHGQ